MQSHFHAISLKWEDKDSSFVVIWEAKNFPNKSQLGSDTKLICLALFALKFFQIKIFNHQ